MDVRIERLYREYLERFEYFGRPGQRRLRREELAELFAQQERLQESAAPEAREALVEIRRLLLSD